MMRNCLNVVYTIITGHNLRSFIAMIKLRSSISTSIPIQDNPYPKGDEIHHTPSNPQYPASMFRMATLARKRPLRRTIRSPSPPMRLIRHTSILTHTSRFPRLIESLKKENIHSPIQNPTYASLPETRR